MLKVPVYRSEAYRRRVASLSCVNCGMDGHSQCAHANGHAFGKGMGTKADDRFTFPLCADGPGYAGCHSLFDQHKLIPADEIESTVKRWISWTRAALGE